MLLIAEIRFLQRTRRATSSPPDNVANIVRHSVEIGLLALVMTPVILTGGIDLSVGSTARTCARCCFGKLWRDAGLDPLARRRLTLGIGALAAG